MMESSVSPVWLASIVEPLASRFGDDLTVCRDGNAVRWGFGGQSAVVELRADGKLHATFIDRTAIDAVSQRPAACAYRAFGFYALTAASCSRMIADMVDFFSGVREPKFTFVDAYPR